MKIIYQCEICSEQYDTEQEALGGNTLSLSQRQLETRVGKCMKELGWTKVKKRLFNIWIKKVDSEDTL